MARNRSTWPGTLDGQLVTSFTAYQPRTFAIKLGSAPTTAAAVHSEPVTLDYDLATASNNGSRESQGFDGKGNSLPAEMLPAQLTFDDVKFQLAPAKSGVPNAVVAKGQSIHLPSGQFNRLYIVAASADGDQKASFELDGKTVELNIQDWGGFIGQWDDRKWSKSGADDDYGEMTALEPGFIKRADLAWFDSNHRNAAGENVPYRYSYLFAYGIDVPPGTRSVKLPVNNKIRVLAMSVVQQSPELQPVQPLYDVLPPSESQKEVREMRQENSTRAPCLEESPELAIAGGTNPACPSIVQPPLGTAFPRANAIHVFSKRSTRATRSLHLR